MVFAVALPSPPRSDEADELSLPTWQWLAGSRRPSEVRAGSLLSPARLPSSLRPASSLRPTNGTSARLCLPQPQTLAKLAGLAAFALKCWAPFWVRLKPDMASRPPLLAPPPLLPFHRHTPPLQSGWQASRQAAVLSGGSLLDQGGQGARDESLLFSLCGKG